MELSFVCCVSSFSILISRQYFLKHIILIFLRHIRFVLVYIKVYCYWNRKYVFTKPETDSDAAFTVIVNQLRRADTDPEAVLSAGSSRDLVFAWLHAPGIEAGIPAEWCCPHRAEVRALDKLHDRSRDWIWQREWRRSLGSTPVPCNRSWCWGSHSPWKRREWRSSHAWVVVAERAPYKT